MIRARIGIFIIFITFLLFAPRVLAQEFNADYAVQYFLTENNQSLNSEVRFQIKITNLRSDVYVNKFFLAFPKTFQINNLTAVDDNGQITPNMTYDDRQYKIDLEFSHPSTGKNSTNTFFLTFNQQNLFKINGNVWEVIIPTIDSASSQSNYKVVVNLPKNTDKKIAIAKPKPDYISGKQIVWDNPKTKTIYAVFGDRQYYQLELNYNLKNPKLVPVYMDVSFPPDTLYQKNYLDSINPIPASVHIDEDGNFMGRYFLKPKENKLIVFKGIIEVLASPRSDINFFIKNNFNQQKKYLLSPQKYWQLDNIENIKTFKTVYDIYNFTTNSLNYNYNKITGNIKRLGAKAALEQPNQSVCTEFTDLFIALAREKGIYSREIEGYGFSNDVRLRPLSLISDVLHAWPEYYQETTNLWIPIDPTWENTSGIDYFSSFDLNHIVFAIHGKKSDYPIPAGMYKTEDSKDILIKPTDEKPKEKIVINSQVNNVADQINDQQKYTGQLIIRNSSNTFLWSIPVKIDVKHLSLSNKLPTLLTVLAPYQEITIPIEYQAQNKNKQDKAYITVSVSDKKIYEKNILISPFYYQLGIKITYIFFGFCLIFLLITGLKKIGWV